MVKLTLTNRLASAARILCLGAHCDDIEIGCGGTLLTLLEKHGNADVYWVVFSGDERRAAEARESAASFLACARSKEIVIKDFRNSFFPFIGATIKEYFEELKNDLSPDLIFTHYREDLHQDHRLISQLTWNTFRDHLILEYEIPKYDGDLGSPNVFVHLDEATCRRKIEYVVQHFRSQKEKQWFGEETFFALLRLRGIESNAPGKYAEAFYCRKAILDYGSEAEDEPR